MRPEDIVELLKRRPFKPFTIVMMSGRDYTIEYPDQVMLTPSSAIIGIQRLDDFTYERREHIALDKIEHFEKE